MVWRETGMPGERGVNFHTRNGSWDAKVRNLLLLFLLNNENILNIALSWAGRAATRPQNRQQERLRVTASLGIQPRVKSLRSSYAGLYPQTLAMSRLRRSAKDDGGESDSCTPSGAFRSARDCTEDHKWPMHAKWTIDAKWIVRGIPSLPVTSVAREIPAFQVMEPSGSNVIPRRARPGLGSHMESGVIPSPQIDSCSRDALESTSGEIRLSCDLCTESDGGWSASNYRILARWSVGIWALRAPKEARL